MNSHLYQGWLRHRRLAPSKHDFGYRLFMVYLDLDELDSVFAKRWFWSSRRWALACFRRADHFGNKQQPLVDTVRDLVASKLDFRPSGPIRLLTNLRYFGYCINPISIYYCFDSAGEKVDAIVAEVTNTPWGETYCYTLDTRTGLHQQFSKCMHVSPFMPMQLCYDWQCNVPGQALNVHMNVLQNNEKLFDATLSLRRRSITGKNLARVLVQFPFMTGKVVTAIYWQALRLWLKRVKIFDHPGDDVLNSTDTTTSVSREP